MLDELDKELEKEDTNFADMQMTIMYMLKVKEQEIEL